MQDDTATDANEPFDAAPGTLLLIGSDAATDALREVLLDRLPVFQVLTSAGLPEARALLREAPIDLILTDHALGDATSLEVLAARDELVPGVPVVVQAEDTRAETIVAVMRAGASDYVYRDDAGAYLRGLPDLLQEVLRRDRQAHQEAAVRLRRQQEAWWERVRALLAFVSHEIKNPLSIISGNAQLLLELANVMEIEDDLLHPIQDIEEASRRVADSLLRLNEVRSLNASDIRQREDRLFGTK